MGKFWLSVSYLVIQIHLVTAATKQELFWHDTELDDTVCTAIDASPDFIEVQSKMQCLAHCTEMDECHSVFYKDESCLLSDLSRLTMNSAVCQSVAGYKLYHKGCAPGYVLNEQERTCFRVYTECKNWHDARVVCQSEGADLLVLKDKNFFQSQTLATNDFQCFRSGFWVGYTDAEDQDTWKWVDGSQANEGLWYPGEPEGFFYENCAADLDLSFPIILVAASCSSTHLSFVCGYQI